MTTKHTPEPWKAEKTPAALSTQQQDYLITYSDGELRSHVARLFDNSLCAEHGTTEANASRIVACVNACEGLTAPETQVNALRKLSTECVQLRAERYRLREINAELLGMLRGIIKVDSTKGMKRIACAAIKKAVTLYEPAAIARPSDRS